MGKRKKDSVYIYVDVEDRDILREEAIRSNVDMRILAGVYIKCGIDFQIHRPGWESRIIEALDQAEHNKYAFLDSNECPALQFDEKDYRCIWYREFKPPTVLVLGDTESKARAHCAGCTKSKKFIADANKFKALVKNGFVMDIPSCIYGGRISGEGKKVKLYCQNPKMDARSRSVHDWCKKLKKGGNCDGLRWTRMTGKLPDMKK